nr:MAG TPA: hypothetical protein [Caudoviricetes sp.]
MVRLGQVLSQCLDYWLVKIVPQLKKCIIMSSLMMLIIILKLLIILRLMIRPILLDRNGIQIIKLSLMVYR